MKLKRPVPVGRTIWRRFMRQHPAKNAFFHRQFRKITGTTPQAVRFGASSLLDDLREKL